MQTNYMQIIPQTDEEKLKMYMKLSRRELAKMLLNANKYLDLMRPQIYTPSPTIFPEPTTISYYTTWGGDPNRGAGR